MLVHGAPGVGKSRLLDELGLAAQIAGATVLRPRCDVEQGAYGLAKTLIRAALTRAPDATLDALRPQASTLGHLVEELDERIPDLKLSALPENMQERRAQIQHALRHWLIGLRERLGLMVVLIDDIDAADESSAAFIGSVAFEAPRRALLLVATTSKKLSALGASQRIIGDEGELLRLRALDEASVLKLAGSLFGQVQNLPRLAKWFHVESRGNPLTCVELARHLYQTGAVRYIDGSWVLPQELASIAYGAAGEQALDIRLADLSPELRRAAESLSVTGGPLSAELCAVLARQATDDPYRAVDGLTARGVLVASGADYAFSQESLREALWRAVPDERRKELHAIVGEALAQSAGPGREIQLLKAGFHLLRSDRETRGLELARRALAVLTELGDSLPEVVDQLETTVELLDRRGAPAEDVLDLPVSLTTAGYMVDRKYADRYGERTLKLLLARTGLEHARKLQTLIGKKGALLAGTLLALGRLRFSNKDPKKALAKAYEQLVVASTCLVGVGSLSLDVVRVRQIVDALEPLASLPESNIGSLLYRYCAMQLATSEGRELDWCTLGRRILEQFDDPTQFKELPDETRRNWKGGLLLSLGLVHAYRGDSSALEYAERLENLGLKMQAMFAEQLRMLYHAYRGEVDRMPQHQNSVERYAVEGGTTWQAECFAPTVLLIPHLFAKDVVGLKQCAAQLEVLSRSMPTLGVYRDIARALLGLCRGQARAVIPELERLAEECMRDRRAGWLTVPGALAEALNTVGEHARAKAICERTRALPAPETRQFVMMLLGLERELARAEAGLGQIESAIRRIEALIAEHRPGGNPLLLGLLHSDRMELALQAGAEKADVEAHLTRAKELFRSTNNPMLIVRAERLAEKARRSSVPPGFDDASESSVYVGAVKQLLSDCANSEERSRRALELILAQCGASAGWLYKRDGDRLSLAARINGEAPPQGAEDRLRGLLSHYTKTLALPKDSDETQTFLSSGERGLEPGDACRALVLAVPALGGSGLVGGAVIAVRDDDFVSPGFQFLRSIASALIRRRDAHTAPTTTSS